MSVIRVEPRDGRNFEVEIAEEAVPGANALTFSYQVRVDDKVIAELDLDPEDGAALTALVRESFSYLLAREPAGSILPTFDLSVISSYFPGYLDEIRSRVAR